MTISFFFTLLSFLVMIVISVLTYILHKKKTLITFDVQQGIKCYSCKQDIVPDTEDLEKYTQLSSIYTRISNDEKSQDFKMCMSCSRDEKLRDLTSKFFIKKHHINNLKKALYSKKYEKTFFALLLLMIVGHVIDFVIRYYFNLRTPFGSSFTIIYWIIWYKKSTLSYGEKKKPSN